VASIGSRVADGARSTLDAWRERGADRLDPIRFHFIEALDQRASGHSGQVRRILDDRLSALIAAYADDLERAASKIDNANPMAPQHDQAPGMLAGLLDYIASRAPTEGDGSAAGTTLPGSGSWPELAALDDFRAIWSKLSTEGQLLQSLEQVPGNAGPLNSSSLVHRSLSLMRELSPGYLQQFLSYVDALSWLEQMNGGGALAGKDAPRAGGVKKSARGKPLG